MPKLVIMGPIPKKNIKSEEVPLVDDEGFKKIADRAEAAGLTVTREGIRFFAGGELEDYKLLIEGLDGWTIGILHTSRR